MGCALRLRLRARWCRCRLPRRWRGGEGAACTRDGWESSRAAAVTASSTAARACRRDELRLRLCGLRRCMWATHCRIRWRPRLHRWPTARTKSKLEASQVHERGFCCQQRSSRRRGAPRPFPRPSHGAFPWCGVVWCGCERVAASGLKGLYGVPCFKAGSEVACFRALTGCLQRLAVHRCPVVAPFDRSALGLPRAVLQIYCNRVFHPSLLLY